MAGYAYEKLVTYRQRNPTRSRFLIFGGVSFTILLCFFVFSPSNWRAGSWHAQEDPSDLDDWQPPPPGKTASQAEEKTEWYEDHTSPNTAESGSKTVYVTVTETATPTFATTATVSHVAATTTPSGLSIEALVRAVYEPLKVDILAPSWVDESTGKEFRLPENPVWTKPLGKRLCLVDIDTRPLDEENKILGPGIFSWKNFGQTSGGILGHYLYAMIHGYDYKFVRTHNFEDRASYWTKIPALSDILHEYEFAISIDADAQINHPEIPFEWLLNRWNVTETTALTMAIDPDEPQNYDPYGKIYNNAGFVVAHNIPRTHEILKTWASCPDEPEKHFKTNGGCRRWKNPWPAEQAAFGEYVRYQFKQPGDVNEVPCEEANGFPDYEPAPYCNGTFIKHMWAQKWDVKNSIEHGFMSVLMSRIRDQFISEKDDRVVERKTNNFEWFNASDFLNGS